MKSLQRIFRLLLDPGQSIWLAILGILLFSVISNGIYDWISTVYGVQNALFGTVVFLTVLVIILWIIRRIYSRSVVVRDLKPRHGVIVSVSQGKLDAIPATVVLEYHFGKDGTAGVPGDKVCWLLVTPKPIEKDSLPLSAWNNAEELSKRYSGVVKVIKKEVDSDDPQRVSMAVEQAINEAKKLYKMDNSQLVADVTGGTKPMTTGMVLAAVSGGLDVSYLLPNKVHKDGRAVPNAGSIPMLLDLGFFRKNEG